MAIRFPVEAGHVMMFARAVGDANPVYADESYAKASETGSVIAPPTFAQASAQFDPEYPLRPKIGKPWFGSGKAPGVGCMPSSISNTIGPYGPATSFTPPSSPARLGSAKVGAPASWLFPNW